MTQNSFIQQLHNELQNIYFWHSFKKKYVSTLYAINYNIRNVYVEEYVIKI